MPKWTPDEHGCIYDEAGCFARLTPNKAERLAKRHNADIDALTAERNELQRRLAEVVVKISEAVVSDDDCVCSMLCHSAITAIAEGREE